MQTSETIHPDKLHGGTVAAKRSGIGAISRVEELDRGYLCIGDRANLALSFLDEHLFRVKLMFDAYPDWTTTPGVLPWEKTIQASREDTERGFLFTTKKLSVRIDAEDASITVTDAEGKVIGRQTSFSWDARGAVTGCFAMDERSHFYGLGEKTSYLDKRGESYTMWNTDVYAPHVPEIEALYQSIPLLLHVHDGASCGIFLDNPGRTTFDMRSRSDLFAIESKTGDYDYYFIYGPELKQVISCYTALTGRMQMPPKWALGYHQSKYSYKSEEEVMALARTFRDKRIPCDVIHLDIHYMDEYRVFTFDSDRFPQPQNMIAELKKMGFHIVPIVDPGVKQDPKYPVYREGVLEDRLCKKLEGDVYFGDVWPGRSAFPDFTKQETAAWWGDLHRYYTDMGIAGIWNDMNEPAVFNESKTMDLDVVHDNNGKMKTHEEWHNLYGMLMSKATFEGLQRHLEGERPFVLTRAGYSGIQRYAAVWTGDNRSFWEHMAMAMPMVLNMGLSGIPFAGPDIGGFAHHTNKQLLIRWTQMGALFPFCRNHNVGDFLDQEPWAFDQETEDICRAFIGLRYQLMPYLYTLFHEAAQTGIPVMRPLLLEYPEDQQLSNLCDQFLLGRDLLVAPIYRPDTEHRTVYLPEGEWFDYWTGTPYTGGQHLTVHAPLDTMPLFVRGGAIIPHEPLKQHAADQTEASLLFHLYGGAPNSSYELYEDDGLTYAYEKGAYNLLRVEAECTGRGLKLGYEYERKGYKPAPRKLCFYLHGLDPDAVTIEGLERLAAKPEDDAEGWYVDERCHCVVIAVRDDKSKRTIELNW
ncbi:TIM-barrel domain-containing protein [Paenibacillus dendritiformis]|uniref:glycoside hydrolase family 31 protein n=1 Tax=Paenibacillus dendritiformis TaxID=130049 RepID=UPI00365CFC8A